jgi:hypothetical protein
VKTVRVGVGAGFSDDRLDPAVELAEQGELDYLVFECLAERTIARESLTRAKDPNAGYAPLLRDRVESVLQSCASRNSRIVTNMGAANPVAAASVVLESAKSLGLKDTRVAVIEGDQVEHVVRANPQLSLMEDGEPVETLLPRLISANAYLGADVVRDALATGAQVVIGGRIADPSLFLGCLLHGHGWHYDDYQQVAAGTAVGHLLECSAQLSGGCFADPGKKEVPDLHSIGFPYADVSQDGEVILGKVAGSGGLISAATCTEQLLYEVHNPSAYITPDCVLDFTEVDFEERERDRVVVRGARARPRTDTYKVVVGYRDGWIGTGEIGYAGPNALARARMTEQIMRERLRKRGLKYEEIRVDYIGMSSLHGGAAQSAEPYEVRLRIAGRTQSRKEAEALGFEVRTLHVNGPAGGGGGSNSIREVLAVKSLLLPRALVKTRICVEG